MALDFKLSNAGANEALDAVAALLDGGSLRIYSAGSGVPATADTALTDQVLLAQLALGTPAFAAAVAGVAAANAITADSSANATGTAAFFRALTSAAAVVCQGTVATATADLVMNSVAIQSGAEVRVDSWSLTLPKEA